MVCRKETYERVLLHPFQHLVSELSAAMFAIDPELELMTAVSSLKGIAIKEINMKVIKKK